jgi:hypothetical protein
MRHSLTGPAADHSLNQTFGLLAQTFGRWASIAAAAGDPFRGCRVSPARSQVAEALEEG